jgi:ribosomal protein L22
MADETPTPAEPEETAAAAPESATPPAAPEETPAPAAPAAADAAAGGAADEPAAEEPTLTSAPAPAAAPAAPTPASKTRAPAPKTKAAAPAAKGAKGAGAGKTPAATKAKAPAPTRSKRAIAPRPDGVAPPVVRAQAKYVRTSARKARLVCDHIRGKSVVEARAILAFAPRAVAADWAKLLNSAVANAEHNHELVGEDLRVLTAFADEGPTLKRFRPRAMGRATPIRKRTSHLTITLTPKE